MAKKVCYIKNIEIKKLDNEFCYYIKFTYDKCFVYKHKIVVKNNIFSAIKIQENMTPKQFLVTLERVTNEIYNKYPEISDE